MSERPDFESLQYSKWKDTGAEKRKEFARKRNKYEVLRRTGVVMPFSRGDLKDIPSYVPLGLRY